MLEFEVAVKNRLFMAGERIKRSVRNFLTDEKGDTNMISVIIILVIVVLLAVAFRKAIGEFVETLWGNISGAEDTLGGDFNLQG